MNLSAVMAEIGDALDVIDGLNVYPYPAHNVSAPAVVVGWPELVTYDETYGRGMDRIADLPVVVLVGSMSDRASALNAAKYADAAGPMSVKQAVEAHTYTACDIPRVASSEFDVFTVGGQDYAAVVFHLDVTGDGNA